MAGYFETLENKLIYDMMSKKCFNKFINLLVQELHCGDQHFQVHYKAVERLSCLRNILPFDIITF